jgi:hypothetical protein
MRPVIYCADIGSIPNRRFGWSRSAADDSKIERRPGGTEIDEQSCPEPLGGVGREYCDRGQP